MRMMFGAFGHRYGSDYDKAHPWSKKSGEERNVAIWNWKHGKAYNDEKPEGWLSREEMTSQIDDLNKRYDTLKIDYDKLSQQRAPTVHQSNPNWRDVHGGHGSQDTNVDNVKIAKDAEAAKKKTTPTSSAPKPTQTYTGTATL